MKDLTPREALSALMAELGPAPEGKVKDRRGNMRRENRYYANWLVGGVWKVKGFATFAEALSHAMPRAAGQLRVVRMGHSTGMRLVTFTGGVVDGFTLETRKHGGKRYRLVFEGLKQAPYTVEAVHGL